MGTMYFFDMGQGGASGFEIWNSLPEDQHPKNQLSSMEDSFDGKQMGDGLAARAGKYRYKIPLWNLLAWGQGFLLTDSQSQGDGRGGCDSPYG